MSTSKTEPFIPYGKYFEFFPAKVWSLQHFSTMISEYYENTDKRNINNAFYKALKDVVNDQTFADEAQQIAKELIKKKRDIKEISVPAPSLSSSTTVLGKRKENPNIENSSSSPRKQCIIDHCFHPNVDVPLQADGSLDILGVVKATICVFDQKIITLGSFRSYKNSDHLLVNSEKSVKVPRESTYDAEMYRILVNWLAKVHEFEITGQWHLEGISNDGNWHHHYCDLTIKKPENPYPEAVIELIATGSNPELRKHFDKVLNYANKLKSREVWLVHFSREDSVASHPYWPSEQLQGRGLNVMHFWHDMDFGKVCMSAKFRDVTGKSHTIVNEQILP